MVRKTALVTAMLGAFASQSFAMGLGDIRLNSVLNQPLLAEVELLSPTPADLAALRVGLASNEAYNKAGVERAFFHTKLRFEIVSRPNGTAAIKITSREAVREPYLDFLLEATWGSGQVLREYTVLIDPPALMPAAKPVTRAQVAAAPTTATAPRTSAPVPSASSRANATGVVDGEYHVSHSDTLWGVATAVRPDSSVSMEQTMLGLLEANPNAFYDQNINNLKAGYVLRVPSREEMTAVGEDEARAETRRQNALWREGHTAETKTAGTSEVPATSAPNVAAAAESAAADAQLKLVTPENQAADNDPAASNVAELRKDLALAVESVEAQRQENQDLNARLKQLEDQLSQLHRMIELKDNQAAQLAGTATPAEEMAEAAPPAVETPDSGASSVDPATLDRETGSADDTEMATEMPEESVTSELESSMPSEALEESEGVAVPEASAPVAVPPVATAPVQPAPVPETTEEGFLASLLANPMFKWAAAGGVVLLGLLTWLGMRRRGDDGDFQESILAERHAKVTAAAPNYAAPVAATAATEKAHAAKAPTRDPAQDPTQTDSSLFTDFAVSDMGAIHNDAEADPVAEADVYLAYGRYQQAEELIRSALNHAPQRSDLKLKLLEVLFAAKNANSFDSEAEAFLASEGRPDSDEWQRVVEMGLELNPGNPLYGDAGPAASTDNADADLDFSMDSPGAEPDNGLDRAASAAPAESDDNSLDFDMDELESFSPRSKDAAPNIPADEDLSFDLSGNDMDDAGEGTLASSDEVATKLDLARAYIEMGDPDGARSILEEVLQEGDAAQKSEAQGLIQRIS